MKALAHHAVLRHDPRADEGIRRNPPPTPHREVEGARHPRPLVRAIRTRGGRPCSRRHAPPLEPRSPSLRGGNPGPCPTASPARPPTWPREGSTPPPPKTPNPGSLGPPSP